MNSAQTPTIGGDGFYHPQNEEEIVMLVKKAASESLEIRCRGAAHSLARVIYTDPGAGFPEVPNLVSEQEPPQGNNINIIFDKYKSLVWLDENLGIIEVDAGIHLGLDPGDPTGVSTLENSLLYQTFQKGWTLSDLGGISHQTVSGFLMTGSAGGSLMYGIDENIMALSVIDGNGNVEWFEKGNDNDPDNKFYALALSLGLLGIVSKVRLQLVKNFNIYGQQIITPATVAECPIDLYGDGVAGKPSMVDFLKQTPYTRLLWYPQKNVDRLVIWQATRGNALPVFDAQPYFEFDSSAFLSIVEELAASVLFTLLGNTKFGATWKKLKPSFAQFEKLMETGWGSGFFAWLFANIITFFAKIIAFPLVLFLSVFKFILVALYPTVVKTLEPVSKKGKAQTFMDYSWRSLPMDNGVDDTLMPTEFTEIWIPLSETKRAMQLLNKMFTANGVKSTGYYMTELYAGKATKFWLSPAYNQDVFRIDFFWFTNNEGDPAAKDGYFSQFWNALKAENIPFRLHWAKFMPEYDYEDWAKYYRSQYPRWDDFMKLRMLRDPKNIFLNDYWSLRLFGKTKSEYLKAGQVL